jgi:hypothetical protein
MTLTMLKPNLQLCNRSVQACVCMHVTPVHTEMSNVPWGHCIMNHVHFDLIYKNSLPFKTRMTHDKHESSPMTDGVWAQHRQEWSECVHNMWYSVFAYDVNFLMATATKYTEHSIVGFEYIHHQTRTRICGGVLVNHLVRFQWPETLCDAYFLGSWYEVFTKTQMSCLSCSLQRSARDTIFWLALSRPRHVHGIDLKLFTIVSCWHSLLNMVRHPHIDWYFLSSLATMWKPFGCCFVFCQHRYVLVVSRYSRTVGCCVQLL